MEHTEKMNKGAKRNMGIISFLPMMAYIAWLVQFVYLHSLYPDIKTSAILYDNYNSTLALFSLCFILTTAVLVYFIVHLARTKLLTEQSKLGWIIFMTFFAPIALPLFWFNEIRNEPERLPVHPNIA